MTLNEDYIVGLVESAYTNGKIKQYSPHFKIFQVAGDFVYDSKYLYYGVFNVGVGGSIKYSLLNSAVIEITPTLEDYAITQPILFDKVVPVKCSFIGVKIEITAGILQVN